MFILCSNWYCLDLQEMLQVIYIPKIMAMIIIVGGGGG